VKRLLVGYLAILYKMYKLLAPNEMRELLWMVDKLG